MHPFSAPYGFLIFQGVEKGCIGNEWVNLKVWDFFSQVTKSNHFEHSSNILFIAFQFQMIGILFGQCFPILKSHIQAVCYFCKNLHLKYLNGFWMSLYTGINTKKMKFYLPLSVVNMGKFAFNCKFFIFIKEKFFNKSFCAATTLRENCPNLEFFLVRIFPYSNRCLKNFELFTGKFSDLQFY